MTRYRCDKATPQSDGAIAFHADWIGGPTLSKIKNCRLINLAGEMRRTVTVTGEADSYFSIPAECSIGGCRVRGYVTGDSNSDSLVFRQVYY